MDEPGLFPQFAIFAVCDPADMRYPTLGDWFQRPGDIASIVSVRFRDPDHTFLVLLHELVEAYLCYRAGVSGASVDAYDLAHLSPEIEPGERLDCPYRHEHRTAEMCERIVAAHLGVRWEDYEQACDAMWEEVSRAQDQKGRQDHGGDAKDLP